MVGRFWLVGFGRSAFVGFRSVGFGRSVLVGRFWTVTFGRSAFVGFWSVGRSLLQLMLRMRLCFDFAFDVGFC